MKYQLIIFDMDGTLVQSEDCASQALIDVIPALTDSVAAVTHRYRGMRLAKIFDDIESSTPGAIPEGCLDLYRAREDALSGAMITPCPGADTMLSRLEVEKCIASNAPVKKTQRSLEICGLSHHFQCGIYSAYDVQAWKPDPTLFLHAATENDVSPKDCLVVEIVWLV
jgi:beta-phosphoglucomutase-like phosphatase (HAD superfamily)